MPTKDNDIWHHVDKVNMDTLEWIFILIVYQVPKCFHNKPHINDTDKSL